MNTGTLGATLIDFGRNGLAVPVLLLVMLGTLVLPLPALVLDVLFTFNISLSLVVILAVIYVRRPLELAVFPTVLLAATLLRLALKDAQLTPAAGEAPLTGDALAEVAREYVLTEAVVDRLARRYDQSVLKALIGGVELSLANAEAAKASADALTAALGGAAISVEPQFDETQEAHRLLVRKSVHGNTRTVAIDQDFLDSGDYAQIRKIAGLLQGLVRPGAVVQRGDHKLAVNAFPEAISWLLEQAKGGMNVQRYKGLGEMNPEQLWETTMDPASRRLLRAQIEDALAADEIFTTLMGDVVEPRRAFIEANALGVRNLDV